LHPDSKIVGQTLAESPIRSRYNAMVIAIKRASGQYIYNPGGSLVLERGDELILIVDRNRMVELRRELAGL
jgi:voltage-gated potassium channel